MSNDINRCLICEAYEPGYGCTHPEFTYPCPELEDLEAYAIILSRGDLPGQMIMFVNGKDDYPIEDDYPY